MTRKTDSERKRDERTRMRAQGFVLRQVWVPPSRADELVAFAKALREG